MLSFADIALYVTFQTRHWQLHLFNTMRHGGRWRHFTLGRSSSFLRRKVFTRTMFLSFSPRCTRCEGRDMVRVCTLVLRCNLHGLLRSVCGNERRRLRSSVGASVSNEWCVASIW